MRKLTRGKSCSKQSCSLLITLQPDEPPVTPLKPPRGGLLLSVSSEQASSEPPSCTQWCLFSSSLSCPYFLCAMLKRGDPVSSMRWTARTDASRSGAAGRSGVHAPSWMTAAVARSVRPAEGSTATARCPGCTGWSADRDYSVSSTRMRTTMETNMASAKVCSRSSCAFTCAWMDVVLCPAAKAIPLYF